MPAKRRRLVAVATGRMLDSVDDYPAVVGSAMRGAVNIVDACSEFSARRKECLAVGEDGGVDRCGDDSVELVVGDDFYGPHVAIGMVTRNGRI